MAKKLKPKKGVNRMYFQLVCEIKRGLLVDGEFFKTVVDHDHKVTVILRGKNTDHQVKNEQVTICFAFLERDISDANLEVFNDFEQGKHYDPATFPAQTYSSDGTFWVDTSRVDQLPESFKGLMESAHKELTESVNNVIDVFIWRMGIRSHLDPIISYTVHWSKDNNKWHLSPLHKTPPTKSRGRPA